MLADGADLLTTIQEHSSAGRIAIIGGERYDETITHSRLHHATLAIRSYLDCLHIENIATAVYLENRWEIFAFYLGVRLHGGFVKILDYNAPEEKLAMDFTGCQLVLCSGRDLVKIFRCTLEKNVKLIVIPPAHMPFNAISMDEVLRIRLNRSLPQYSVSFSQKYSRLLQTTVSSVVGSTWNPRNSMCALIAPLHRQLQFDIAMSCVLLGLPVVLVDIRHMERFVQFAGKQGIDIISIDEFSLFPLHFKCKGGLPTVKAVFIDGKLNDFMKKVLPELFPKARSIKEVTDDVACKL